jgi:hypothetical protein
VADERHDAAFVVGAVVGGVAGAVYALFNAPQAGARTRADLVARWSDAAERLAQGVAALDEGVRQLLGADDGSLTVGSGDRRVPPEFEVRPQGVAEAPDGAGEAAADSATADVAAASPTSAEPGAVPA